MLVLIGGAARIQSTAFLSETSHSDSSASASHRNDAPAREHDAPAPAHVLDRKLVDAEFVVMVMREWVDALDWLGTGASMRDEDDDDEDENDDDEDDDEDDENSGKKGPSLPAVANVMTAAMIDTRMYRELFSRLQASFPLPISWSAKKTNMQAIGNANDDDADADDAAQPRAKRAHVAHVSPPLASILPRAMGLTIDREYFLAHHQSSSSSPSLMLRWRHVSVYRDLEKHSAHVATSIDNANVARRQRTHLRASSS